MRLHPSTMSCGRGVCVRVTGALLVGLLMVSRPAVGQGTTGTLSDPMSTHQLTQFADRLQLDPDQRSAMESIHDEYKSEFRKLRDNEIDDFLERTRALQGMGVMPQREAMESLFTDLQRLQARIKTLDDRFFDALSATLREEQLPTLDRVRLARERQRYESQHMMAMPGHRPVDLSEAFLATDLTPEIRADADLVIAEYERHLTAAMKRVSEAVGRFYLDMFDAFAALGYGEMTEEDLADPDAMKQMMADMQQIWATIGSKQNEAVAAIVDLNRRTYRRVAAFLPPEAARIFRNHYYTAAYPELGVVLSMGEKDGWFAWALGHEDLSDEQREQLAAALAVHRQELDRLVDDAVRLVDDQREKSTPFNFDHEAMQEHQRQLQEIRTAAQELTVATTAAVREIVPEITANAVVEETHQKALALAGVDVLLKPETGPDAAGDAGEVETDRARQATRRIDRWITGPISERDVARYARRLGLGDEAITRLHDLHAGYTTQFDSIEVFDQLQAANQSKWRYDPATGTSQPPSADTLERIDRLRVQAIEQVIRLDRSFFGDVEALVPDEHLHMVARLQSGRLRQVYNVNGAGVPSFAAQSADDGIDLVKLADRTIEDDDLASIDAVLALYELSATDLFRKRFDAQLALLKAWEAWSVEAQAIQGDPAAAMDYARRYKEIVGDASERSDEVCGQLAQLNRRTIEEIVDMLPETAGTSIRLAYERKAYPAVFNDPASIERQLKAAYKLKDLAEQQREQLDALAAEFEPEYLRLSRDMIALTHDGKFDMMSLEADDWREYQKRQEQQQRLQFDRDELCYRGLNTLKTILDVEQIKRIGKLPTPRAESGIVISR